MTLADFLLARIAEDEEVAQWSSAGHGDRWTLRETGREMIDDNTGKEIAGYDGVCDISVARHIARHDPARVLAECEAKRRIVGWATSDSPYSFPPILHLLALPYADHPDYRDEWRP